MDDDWCYFRRSWLNCFNFFFSTIFQVVVNFFSIFFSFTVFTFFFFFFFNLTLRSNVWRAWSLKRHSSKVALSHSLSDSLTKVRYRAARAAKKRPTWEKSVLSFVGDFASGMVGTPVWMMTGAISAAPDWTVSTFFSQLFFKLLSIFFPFFSLSLFSLFSSSFSST